MHRIFLSLSGGCATACWTKTTSPGQSVGTQGGCDDRKLLQNAWFVEQTLLENNQT